MGNRHFGWQRIPMAAIVAAAALLPASVRAQDVSHWGVVTSVTPEWKVPSQLGNALGGAIDVKGSDFTIGIVRGRDLGGDWGVSYTRRTLNDGSVIGKLDQRCATNGCFASGTTYATSGVTLSGVEIHKYVPFATIKRRVQIGMNFAGGVGQFAGQVQTDKREVSFNFDQRTGTSFATPSDVVSTQPVSAVAKISALPVAKVQIAAAVLAARGVKVRFAGGLDFPGYNVIDVSVIYLFGRK